MGFLTVKKTKICFKTQAMRMKRVNFIVKIDNWHHTTDLTKLLQKYLKICFQPFSANVVNFYIVWKQSYFEHMLKMSFNPTDVIF